MVDRGSSSSWKWTTTSSRETRCRSATFPSPGAAVVGATPGKADTRAAPGSKCYRLPKLPISVRWPWEKWRIAADLLKRSREGLPHGWVVGDDEFGRPAHFRAWLRGEHERYVLDVPSATVVRDLQRRRPPRREGRGARRQ